MLQRGGRPKVGTWKDVPGAAIIPRGPVERRFERSFWIGRKCNEFQPHSFVLHSFWFYKLVYIRLAGTFAVFSLAWQDGTFNVSKPTVKAVASFVSPRFLVMWPAPMGINRRVSTVISLTSTAKACLLSQQSRDGIIMDGCFFCQHC